MTKTERIKKKQKATYRHGDLKNGLIQSALQLVQQRSNVEFTLRELAEKTGVTHAAAYRHFKSKNEIMLAIAQDGFDILKGYFKAVTENDPGDIKSLGISYVKFSIENPHYFRVMFHPDIRHPEKGESHEMVGGDAFLILEACIQYNQKNGIFTTRPSYELSLTAWSLVHGLSVLWTSGNLSPIPSGQKIEPMKMAQSISDVLMEGLNSRS